MAIPFQKPAPEVEGNPMLSKGENLAILRHRSNHLCHAAGGVLDQV